MPGAPTEADGPEAVAATRRALDDALARGLGICAALSPASRLEEMPGLARVDRQGKTLEKTEVCALTPSLVPFCENVGASVAKTYGQFPAFEAALLDTEIRDGAQPCFHAYDRAAFKKATGLDVPRRS